MPVSVLSARARGGTLYARSGAATSFVSFIPLFGSAVIPSQRVPLVLRRLRGFLHRSRRNVARIALKREKCNSMSQEFVAQFEQRLGQKRRRADLRVQGRSRSKRYDCSFWSA